MSETRSTNRHNALLALDRLQDRDENLVLVVDGQGGLSAEAWEVLSDLLLVVVAQTSSARQQPAAMVLHQLAQPVRDALILTLGELAGRDVRVGVAQTVDLAKDKVRRARRVVQQHYGRDWS